MTELQQLITDIEKQVGEQLKQIQELNSIIATQSATIAHLNQLIREKDGK